MKDRFEVFKNMSFDELSQSHALRTHSKKVMNIIDQFINEMEKKNLAQMRERLVKLGERHSIYRAKKSDFKMIEFQFIHAIKPIVTRNLSNVKRNDLREISDKFGQIFGKLIKNRPFNDEIHLNNDINFI
jgi:hypothetical protein